MINVLITIQFKEDVLDPEAKPSPHRYIISAIVRWGRS